MVARQLPQYSNIDRGKRLATIAHPRSDIDDTITAAQAALRHVSAPLFLDETLPIYGS
jgi:hypothetical protein